MVCAAWITFSGCATSHRLTAQDSGTFEAVRLKILKVYVAKDGDALYRAYSVLWKDQEVVVNDTFADTDHHAGDTINVLVIKNPNPEKKETHKLLQFHLLPYDDVR